MTTAHRTARTVTPQPFALTADRGRGQRRLTADAVKALAEHYGYDVAHALRLGGYIDRGKVFVGSDYVGSFDGRTLRLDRGNGWDCPEPAPRWTFA
jgi:hypothetical protein